MKKIKSYLTLIILSFSIISFSCHTEIEENEKDEDKDEFEITGYRVKYNANGSSGGSVPVDSNGYNTGDTAAVLGNTGNLVTSQTQDGIILVFYLWNTASDGSGTAYKPGTSVAISGADVMLYAQWSVLRARGPAGGWVFYDKGSYSNGWRYLETAAADYGSRIVWASSYITTGAVSIAIGAGQSNTNTIVTAHGAGTYAAKICDDYSITNGLNVYSDWFLPSRLELDQMYNVLKVFGVGNFQEYYYWSSSEHTSNNNFALLQYFVDGALNTGMWKDMDVNIRAVRDF